MSDTTGITVKELDSSDLISLQRMFEESNDVAELSSRVLGFGISPDILKDRTIGDPDFDSDLLLGAFADSRMVGCIMGVRRPWKEGRERQGWIKFIFVNAPFRRRGVGRLLLVSIESCLSSKGANQLTFGSCAPSYLFPGVPQADTGLLRLLERCEWKKGSERTNLQVDLAATSKSGLEGMEVWAPDIEVSPPGPDEKMEIEAFIGNHFSRSWQLETAPAFRGMSGAVLSVARTTEPDYKGRRIVGFVATNCTNPNWLGPMGVAKSHRRRGVGRRLLLHNLLQARKAGVDRVIIPWVNQENEAFYTQAIGASVHCRFWKMEKI